MSSDRETQYGIFFDVEMVKIENCFALVKVQGNGTKEIENIRDETEEDIQIDSLVSEIQHYPPRRV